MKIFNPITGGQYYWNNGRPVPYNPKERVHKDIKNDTIFDGRGHFTTPYNTGDKHSVNRRWLEFHTIFYTQTGGYDAYYALGRRDSSANGIGKHNELTDPTKEREFKQELMGFDTSNEGDKSMPSMQVYLFPYRDWEQILQPNDYVAIRVKEQYPDDPHWDKEKDPYEHHGIEERTLMTGLISDIRYTYNQQQARMYSITCQGMQKILNDVYLGLPREAQISDVNLLFDINGESNPANEQFPFFGGGSAPVSSGGGSTGGGAFGLSGVAGKIAKCLSTTYHCTKAQCAGAIGNALQESGLNPHCSGGGLWQNTSGSSGGVASQTIAVIKKNDSSHKFKSATDGSSSPSKCAEEWCNIIERPNGGEANLPRRESAAEHYYHKMH